jgi:hypothetical protein
MAHGRGRGVSKEKDRSAVPCAALRALAFPLPFPSLLCAAAAVSCRFGRLWMTSSVRSDQFFWWSNGQIVKFLSSKLLNLARGGPPPLSPNGLGQI